MSERIISKQIGEKKFIVNGIEIVADTMVEAINKYKRAKESE